MTHDEIIELWDKVEAERRHEKAPNIIEVFARRIIELEREKKETELNHPDSRSVKPDRNGVKR